MNCRDFENVVLELAGGRTLAPAERERSLAHAEACARCAARLARERALAAELAALAADDLDKIAPPHVEAALLKAFWQQGRPAPAPPEPSRPWALSSWTLMAAALVLLAVGVMISMARRPKSPPHPLAPGSELILSVDRPPEQSPVTPGPAAVEPRPSRKFVRGAPTRVQVGGRGRPRGPERRPVIAAGLIRDGLTVYANDGESPREIATDFMMLSSVNNFAPIDRGKVVRVQIPRSALVSFGLPMNAERAEIPIKADLLLGEDGVARAIRFIR
ncbi:MAG TPA: hypothetical protein VJ302_06180 [Blastocatellia bacterium]|nr:hypothetical protein [Blastocatellia bacterium]